MIVIDTLRIDHVSYTGSTRARTRRIDDVASRGIWFENAISQSPWTVPSVGSLLTGRYPSIHGSGRAFGSDAPSADGDLVREGISPDVPTLAQILSQAGWSCAAFVANTALRPMLGYNRGFGTYRVLDPPASVEIDAWWQSDRMGQWRLDLLNLVGYHEIAETGHFVEDLGDATAAEAAIHWLHQHAEKPFFLWLHLMAVHDYLESEARWSSGCPRASSSPRSPGSEGW